MLVSENALPWIAEYEMSVSVMPAEPTICAATFVA